MCHEVRTPLNGCLASAEMLLEMPLQVSSKSAHLQMNLALTLHHIHATPFSLQVITCGALYSCRASILLVNGVSCCIGLLHLAAFWLLMFCLHMCRRNRGS